MNRQNLNRFYLHTVFFEFTDSMLYLALPIFIYQLYDSIAAVFVFEFAWNLIFGILFLPIFNLGMHLKNPKYFMALGTVFYVVSLYFFGQASEANLNFMMYGTIFYGLYIAFYWPIRNWFFSVNAHHEKVGKLVSIANMIMYGVGFLGPIIAGALSFFFSFNITFTLGAISAFLSMIPIFFFHAPPHPKQYPLKKVFRMIKKPHLKAIRGFHFWNAFDYHFGEIAWLLVFFIFIGDIFDLGLLVGVTTFLAAATTWLMGKWFDGRKRKKALEKSTFFHGITTIALSGVFFFPHPVYIWMVNFINELSVTASETVTESYIYGLGNKVHPVHFNLNNEIYLTIGRFLSSGLLIIAFTYLPEEYLWLAIVLGGFAVFGRLSLRRVDHLLH